MKKQKPLMGKFVTIEGERFQYQGKRRDQTYSFRNFETGEAINVKGDQATKYLEKL